MGLAAPALEILNRFPLQLLWIWGAFSHLSAASWVRVLYLGARWLSSHHVSCVKRVLDKKSGRKTQYRVGISALCGVNKTYTSRLVLLWGGDGDFGLQ